MNSTELVEYHQRKLVQLFENCMGRGGGSTGGLPGKPVVLSELPLVSKDIYRQQTAYLSEAPFWRMDHRSTSGSTGSPFSFYKDRMATGFMEAVQNDAYAWHGINVGEPQARFWGMPRGGSGVLARCKDILKNRIRFSAFDLSEAACLAFHRKLLKFNPTYFYGYPSLILHFARFLDRHNLSLKNIPLKVVIGTGEFVYAEEKLELEERLGCRFVSEYGCSEVGVIGFDCQHGNMHVTASNVIVEIVDNHGRTVPEGEEGEVVVTELHAKAVPFVRYRLGDRGILLPSGCSCGRNLPLLKISAGRKDDYIRTPEGKIVYDAILAYTLKRGIVQFKAVQPTLDKLRIDIVTDDKFSTHLEEMYKSILQDALSNSLVIEFVKVDHIDREKSGKMRYFRSEIKEFTHE
ncbi:phenylacetate--CoA ligase family protein [Geomonas limicola]|nr:AMP-binding protein [Geomonas limicola]